MDEPELYSIGRFARLSGLSIGALRHYDELGLLSPARVDEWTSYRFYRADQLDRARTIRRLRDLELPIETIRELLATDDPRERQALLVAHRDRIQGRTWRLQRVLHVLTQMTLDPNQPTNADTTHLSNADTNHAHEEAGPMTIEAPMPTELDPATRRQLAADLFNHTWELLETVPRTPAQDDEMLHCAHASRYHWGEVGEATHLARGEWQCSRVYAVLGRAEPAVWHARRCVALCEENGLGDWDIAAAFEAMARASLVTDDAAAARDWLTRARDACAAIADDEDRRIIESDLATLGLD